GYRYVSLFAEDIYFEWGKNGTPLPLIAYYGTGRAVFDTPQKRRNFKKEYSLNDAYQDALDAKNNFRRFFEYFYELENYERREKEERRDWNYRFPQLETIREAISRMMPEFSNPHSKIRPLRFMVEWHHDDVKQTLRIDQLSDGFRTTLAMVMDIATRLSLLNPSGKAALDSTGIVLIDEIDLHLHPSWQQRILPDLMRTFPNIQFIVTTHSPQVLTSIPADCIRIIRDGQVFSAPPGTEGAESSRLLKRVQGVDIRPSNSAATKELKEYLALVDADQWDSPRAKELRQQLDARYQGEEPALLEADLQIENRKWELDQ
ncbi:MAG: AAA family ATPase, partial [Gammaproteobacteria bacterium]